MNDSQRLRAQPWWASMAGSVFGLTPGILAPGALPDAQRLLYEVYFEEQGWDPFAPNASGVSANHDARRFEDELDHQAVWVGIYDRTDTLVGITRIIARSVCGLLELERYIGLPEQLLQVDGEIVEPNRLALARTHRSRFTLMLLHFAVEWVCHDLGAARCFGAMAPRVGQMVAETYGWHETGLRFRYHPQDPEPVDVFHFGRADLGPLRTFVKMMLRQARRKLRKLGQHPERSSEGLDS